jgi:cytochrome P450
MLSPMKFEQRRFPPGPTEAYSSTEDLFRWMNENFVRYGDIYKASVFGSDVYVVSAPKYCERILRSNWQNYPRKGQVVKRIALLLGNGLIASNGELWKSQRQMIQPAFSKNAVTGLTNIITSVNAELLQKWKLAAEDHVTVNTTHDVSVMVLKLTLIVIFGDDYPIVAPHFNILVDESARNLEFAAAFRPLGKIILEVAEARRRDGSTATDVLGQLMRARDRKRRISMSDTQLAKEIMTLIVAGHETTASLINWMWYLLSRYPESEAKLSNEFDRLPWGEVPTTVVLGKYSYTRQVIDEALRLYPPLWLMTRMSVNDDQLGDFFVPAGTEIYISPYLLQRSPYLWEAPDHFDPDRMSPDNGLRRHELALCPFGAGPRNCIGESLARAEIQIHLMMFARELRLCYDEERPAKMKTGMNLLSKDDFIMRPEMKFQAPRVMTGWSLQNLSQNQSCPASHCN